VKKLRIVSQRIVLEPLHWCWEKDAIEYTEEQLSGIPRQCKHCSRCCWEIVLPLIRSRRRLASCVQHPGLDFHLMDIRQNESLGHKKACFKIKFDSVNHGWTNPGCPNNTDSWTFYLHPLPTVVCCSINLSALWDWFNHSVHSAHLRSLHQLVACTNSPS